MMIFKNCVKSNPIITRTAQKKVARIDIGIKAPKLVAILAGTPFGIRIVRFLSWANFMNSAAITLTRASIITAAYVPTPWTTPLLINPYLSSGGDVRCVIAQVALLVILFIIYYPFAKIWEARMIEEEKA